LICLLRHGSVHAECDAAGEDQAYGAGQYFFQHHSTTPKNVAAGIRQLFFYYFKELRDRRHRKKDKNFFQASSDHLGSKGVNC
jgi:hypothetical protein